MESEILERIGFTKGEIKVYFALLELGNSTSGPIILKAKVSRSKVYEILERLKEKGIISESIKENVKYFQASSPERILDYIEEKQDSIKNQKQEFEKELPKLIQMQKSSEDRQEVKVYVGFKGIKTFYNEILKKLKKGDEYLAITFSDVSLDNEAIGNMFQAFHHNRAEKQIKAKILANIKDKEIQEKMNYSNTKFYEFRTTKQILPTGIVIANDIVATFNWGKKPRVFVTICKENAGHYRKFFYSIWKTSSV